MYTLKQIRDLSSNAFFTAASASRTIDSEPKSIITNNTKTIHVLQPINSLWAAGLVNNIQTTNQKLASVDAARNVYLASSYSSNNTLVYDANGSSNTIVPLALNTDSNSACVLKFNQVGVPQWMVNVVGSNLVARTMDVDLNGNVYFGCAYSSNGPIIYNADGSVGFNVTTNVSGTFGGQGNLLIKYNSNGVAQWFTNVSDVYVSGGATQTIINTLTTNTQTNRVYASYRLAFSIGRLTLNNVSKGNISFTTNTNNVRYNAYLASFNMDTGELQWRIRMSELSQISSISIDSSTNVIIAGNYKENTSFGNTIITTSNDTTATTLRGIGGTSAGFLAKVDSNGTYLWHTTFDGSGNDDTALGTATDNSNNVYVCGRYGLGSSLNAYNSDISGSNIAFTYPTMRSSAAWLAKYSSNGQFTWGTYIDSAGVDNGQLIQVDQSQNVFLAGTYSGSANVYNASNVLAATQFTLSNTSGQGIFINCWGASGSAQYNMEIDGTGTDTMSGFAMANDGSFAVAGRYISSNVPSITFKDQITNVRIPIGSSNSTTDSSMYIAMNTESNQIYTLLSDLTSASYGLEKTFINPTNSTYTLRIFGSDMTFQTSIVIPPKGLKKLMWYDSWYPV